MIIPQYFINSESKLKILTKLNAILFLHELEHVQFIKHNPNFSTCRRTRSNA